MQKKSSALTKLVGAVLIFLTFASTAVVIAQSCHEEPVPVTAAATIHASHGDHLHAPVASTGKAAVADQGVLNLGVLNQGVLNSGLFSDFCTGVFYLVLFLGGRFLFKSRYNSLRQKAAVFKSAIAFNRPKVVINLTLSLPQLGLCRI